MARRHSHTAKKNKSTSGHKSKSHKGRKGHAKRVGKHPRSKRSTSSSRKQVHHKHKSNIEHC